MDEEELRQLIASYYDCCNNAFQAIYTEFRPRICGLLRCRGAHDNDVEDLTQQVFLCVSNTKFRRSGCYNPEWSLTTWLLTITRHVFADQTDAINRAAAEVLRDEPAFDLGPFAGWARRRLHEGHMPITGACVTWFLCGNVKPPHLRAELLFFGQLSGKPNMAHQFDNRPSVWQGLIVWHSQISM